MEATNADDRITPFVQPKSWVRWAAVVLAVLGWYASLQMLRVSAGAELTNVFMQAVCGAAGEGEVDSCTSVLTSPQAYIRLSRDPGAPRMPVSALGMAYFAVVGLWYLFVGPPTRAGRFWHLLIAALVCYGAWSSLDYIRIMAFELHRWCGGCLVTHAVNGGLLALTLLAWPWRRSAEPLVPHPSARLALATCTVGGLALVAHLAAVLVFITGSILHERTDQYAKVLNDPAFIVWDFQRQPEVSLPLFEDEVFAGSPAAPNTVVLFSDFQCAYCRQAHEKVDELLAKYPGRLRAVFRHYPQDPQCNPNPKFRAGGHVSGCRAARAAEAARLVGGPAAGARMRKLLYARRDRLPTRPFSQQTEQERALFEDWAVELGLDRAAFAAALESPEAATRIQASIELADQLGISAMPVVYLNGKRLRNWSKLETWDALLADLESPATQPVATAPYRP